MNDSSVSDYELRIRRSQAALGRTACVMLLAALPGCFLGDRAADRTLTIYQLQATDTYPGQFPIDASQLPADTIIRRTDEGGEGTPVTSLEIDQRYPVRLVLVPVNDQ